jgi:hypothetical protein
MSDIYLQITETPAVVTLSAPVISAALSSTVTVANVVSVNVVTMPAITVQAAAPSVTTVAGTVTANVFGRDQNSTQTAQIPIIAYDEGIEGAQSTNVIPVQVTNTSGQISDDNPLIISGKVTANLPALNWNTVKITFTEKSFYNGIYKKGSSGYVNADGGGIPVYLPIDEKFHGGLNPVLTRSIQTGGGATFSGTRWNFQQTSDAEVEFYAATTATDLRLVTQWYNSSGQVSVSITPYSVEPVAITNSVTVGSIPAITGTVSLQASTAKIGVVTASNTNLNRLVQDGESGNTFGVPIIYARVAGGVLDYWKEVNQSSGLPVANQQNSSGNIVPFTINGSVTVGNSVTIGSLPVQLSTTTIGGTSRLNVTLSSATTIGATAPSYGNLYGGSDGTNLRAISVDTSGRTVVTGSVSVANTVPVSGTFWQATQPVSGTVTANIASTTVTISAQPSGALTTRFGSVVTANTAGITTAVTNTSRKYLLAQNISAGTVTIGIGFSPTTTQGIQLTAGAGLTFDSFVPTGAVYWLGATTGAAYTILEG